MRYKFAEVNDRGDTTDWEVKTMMPPSERPDGTQQPDLQFSNEEILTYFRGYTKWARVGMLRKLRMKRCCDGLNGHQGQVAN